VIGQERRDRTPYRWYWVRTVLPSRTRQFLFCLILVLAIPCSPYIWISLPWRWLLCTTRFPEIWILSQACSFRDCLAPSPTHLLFFLGTQPDSLYQTSMMLGMTKFLPVNYELWTVRRSQPWAFKFLCVTLYTPETWYIGEHGDLRNRIWRWTFLNYHLEEIIWSRTFCLWLEQLIY